MARNSFAVLRAQMSPEHQATAVERTATFVDALPRRRLAQVQSGEDSLLEHDAFWAAAEARIAPRADGGGGGG